MLLETHLRVSLKLVRGRVRRAGFGHDWATGMNYEKGGKGGTKRYGKLSCPSQFLPWVPRMPDVFLAVTNGGPLIKKLSIARSSDRKFCR